MPKVKYIGSHKAAAVNHLAGLFHTYRVARGMTSEDVGKAVGCSAGNARNQMRKPGRDWSVGQLIRYCDALGIPYQEAFEAAAR